MRCPRKCGFRPWTDSLEHVSPVSTLLPGLLAATPPATDLRIAESELGTEPQGGATGAPIHRAPSIPVRTIPAPAATGIIATTGDRGGSGPSPTELGVLFAAPVGRAMSDPVPVDNPLGLSTPTDVSNETGLAAARRTPAPPAAQPQSAGVANGGNNTVAAAGTGTAGAPAAASAATSIASGAGIIRPMAMAPSQPATAAVQGFQSHALGGPHAGSRAGLTGGHAVGIGHGTPMASGSDGGESGTPANKAPTLTFSGVGVQLQNPGQNPANYQAVTPVPIGFIANILSSGPGGDYSVKSDSWSGGTEWSSYTTAAASSNPPPVSVSLGEDVTSNASSYLFIVDSDPRQYTITLNVTYTNNATGQATLTFTSVAPSGSLTTQQIGVMNAAYIPPPAGQLLANLSPDIEISATTTVNANTGGNFMFIQICNSIDIDWALNNGNSYFYANNADFDNGLFNGPLLDSGGTLAQAFTYTNAQGQTISGGTSWALPAGGNLTNPAGGATAPFMSDAPYFSAGGVGPQAVSLSLSESFSDYLMYMSSLPGSVWIAISEEDWSWSVTATPNDVPAPTQQNAPTHSTPSDSAAFPTWVNTTGNLLAAGPE